MKVRRYPQIPGPQGRLEETGSSGCEEVLPEIYHSTWLFGPFCTRLPAWQLEVLAGSAHC